MQDWGFAQSQIRASSWHASIIFRCARSSRTGEVEMTITVKEFFTPKDPALLFFAQADKQTNQKVAPFTPCGWGKTLLEALEECVRAVNRFPYQG